jgi:hypothetical protein
MLQKNTVLTVKFPKKSLRKFKSMLWSLYGWGLLRSPLKNKIETSCRFNTSRTVGILESGERCFADKGFQDENYFKTPFYVQLRNLRGSSINSTRKRRPAMKASTSASSSSRFFYPSVTRPISNTTLCLVP